MDECQHVYQTGDDTEVSCPLPVVFVLVNICPEHGVEKMHLCALHLIDEAPALSEFLS